MVKERLRQDAVSNEVRRRILRESLNRYRNELMDDEERQLLLDRIKYLSQELRLRWVRAAYKRRGPGLLVGLWSSFVL